MNQLTLTLEPPKARRRDPVTSHKAAERAKSFAPTHAQRIYAALAGCGDSTADELTELTGLTVVQICRRAVELERDAKIEVVCLNGAPLERDGFRVWRAK